jgi:hypothetical protein
VQCAQVNTMELNILEGTKNMSMFYEPA